MTKNATLTLTEKENSIIFQALVEYRAKVATAANTLSLCGCRPVENQKAVQELDALVRKIAMRGE